MNTENFKKIGNKNGLYLGLIGVLFGLIIWILNLDYEAQQSIQWIGLIPSIAFIAIAMIQYKKSNGGFVKFGVAFRMGLRVVAISIIFSAIWMVLYTMVLEPGYQEQILEATIQQMEEQGQPEQAMDMALSMTEKMTSPIGMIAFTIFGGVFMGLVISVICAAIIKKDNPFPDEAVDAE